MRTKHLHEDQIQVSADGATVWVHAYDGSTVGRFSRRFGMDVHNTATAQLQGLGQCLHCTHGPAAKTEWLEFVSLMQTHHEIAVPVSLMEFA